MCNKNKDSRFSGLGSPKRVWAVPAIHSDVEKLTKLHDIILDHFEPGDRLVYLGNYTGYNPHAVETIEEILTFRRLILSRRGVIPGDLTYLRGAQEEIWQKLLQLQFAPDPSNVLLWMLGNGLGATLKSYGISAHDGIEACQRGITGLTKWTNNVRAKIRTHDGHEIFGTQLKRAAFTSPQHNYPMLFVHAGIDTKKTLEEQGDNFWWSSERFDNMTDPYLPFQKVVRGYDPAKKGVNLNCVTATLDDGCGFGGNLICAGFEPDGNVPAILEA